jgi:hypothetical protein
MVVEGYPIPREALEASLHTRRLRKRGEEVHKRHRTQALGGMCFLRMLAATCFRISFGGMYRACQTQQLPVRPPTLLLFAEHPYSTLAVVDSAVAARFETVGSTTP